MVINVHPKERFYFALMVVISLAAYLKLSLLAYTYLLQPHTKIIMFYVLFGLFFKLLMSILLVGYVQGNAIKVTAEQFPDIYALLQQHAKTLNFKKIPAMYILQAGGVLNAFATRFAGRDFIVMYSDVLETAYQEGKDAVSFIIGHELGHIKRNHVSWFKSLLILPARLITFLSRAYSRACEYTCDAIGYALCPQGAAQGILILAAGKRLYKKVNSDAWVANMKSDKGFAMWLAHIFSTHPPLIHRMAVINKKNQDNLMIEDTPFVSPKVDTQNKQMEQ